MPLQVSPPKHHRILPKPRAIRSFFHLTLELPVAIAVCISSIPSSSFFLLPWLLSFPHFREQRRQNAPLVTLFASSFLQLFGVVFAALLLYFYRSVGFLRLFGLLSSPPVLCACVSELLLLRLPWFSSPPPCRERRPTKRFVRCVVGVPPLLSVSQFCICCVPSLFFPLGSTISACTCCSCTAYIAKKCVTLRLANHTGSNQQLATRVQLCFWKT
ncbi:uncharacterized protein LOC142523906 [Primulina tabacum]|uniref:uncharacterized protein LOC142523906 n=1 Tax=Primulina tabacum TaxID=48773 RepID=UPI003F59581F